MSAELPSTEQILTETSRLVPLSCFYFTVNEISRNKTTNCSRRLTAAEPGARITCTQGLLRSQYGRPSRSFPNRICICKFKCKYKMHIHYKTKVYFPVNYRSCRVFSSLEKYDVFNHSAHVCADMCTSRCPRSR